MPIIIRAADVSDLADMSDQARRLGDALARLAKEGRPTPADLIDAPIIDMWRPARRMAPALMGQVSGHPLLHSNKPKIASELSELDSDGHWARTWSRFYRLAAPPNSRRQ